MMLADTRGLTLDGEGMSTPNKCEKLTLHHIAVTQDQQGGNPEYSGRIGTSEGTKDKKKSIQATLRQMSLVPRVAAGAGNSRDSHC